ncbi:MAG: serine hydrolase domain-containing protein [Acidimicrobiales bacterium]
MVSSARRPSGPAQEAVEELVAEQLAAGEHLGVQVAARLEGRPVVAVTAGWLDPARRRPAAADSLFSLFSCTKGLAALALWRLIERGELRLDGEVLGATVEQVLSHQAGLHRAPAELDAELLADLGAGVAWLERQAPAWPAGEAAAYHTVTFGWLAELLARRHAGKTLSQLVRDEVAAPLGLTDSLMLGLTPEHGPRAAVVVERAEARGLRWVDSPGPHPAQEAFPPRFEPDWNDDRLRRCGHGAFGGWAEARALAEVFGRVDELVGRQARTELSALVTDAPDRCLELAVRRGVGVELGGADEDGLVGSLGPRLSAFGHGGHGGQVAVADPEVGLSIAVLVNLLPAPEAAAERTGRICDLIRGVLGVA